MREAAEGDADAARARLTALQMVTCLDTLEDAAALTRRPVELGGVSPQGSVGCGARQRRCRERCRLAADLESPPHRDAVVSVRIERACRRVGGAGSGDPLM